MAGVGVDRERVSSESVPGTFNDDVSGCDGEESALDDELCALSFAKTLLGLETVTVASVFSPGDLFFFSRNLKQIFFFLKSES